MRFLLHFTAAALLVAIGIGGATSAMAADRDARAAVLGRQKIREELSAALTKGYLTRMDQYRILLHAKEVLTADDLHGLEQSLDRIATRQATTRPAPMTQPAATAVRSDPPVSQSVDDSGPAMIRPSKYEETQDAGMPVIGDPTPTRAKALNGSPLVEEVPPGVGQPSLQVANDDPEGCGCDAGECHVRQHRCFDIDCFAAVDGFKGPIDLDNANGNFGTRLGVNGAVAVLPRLGVGLQAGFSDVLSNLKGSPYPEPNATIRNQLFTTVGMFQRINREEGAFTWGFAYDWLFDDYYADFNFGQWRVKGAWEFDPCNEIGISAAVPEHGSSGSITDFFGNIDVVHFKPIAQGAVYWRHTWCNDASLTGRFGVAEKPGEFVFGADTRMPVTRNMALTGDFTYIMPNAAGGAIAQTREFWNVSIGIEFMLGGFCHGCGGHFQPFLPVADNGSMAVRELGQ